MDSYQLLANAIVANAAHDYRDCRKTVARLEAMESLDKNEAKQLKKARREIVNIEQFFRSDYYKLLTKLDGEMILSKLQREAVVV